MYERSTQASDHPGWGQAPVFDPTIPAPDGAKVVIGRTTSVTPLIMPILGLTAIVGLGLMRSPSQGLVSILGRGAIILIGLVLALANMRSRVEIDGSRVTVVRGLATEVVRRTDIVGITAATKPQAPAHIHLAPGSAITRTSTLGPLGKPGASTPDLVAVGPTAAEPLARALGLPVAPGALMPTTDESASAFRRKDGRLKPFAYAYIVVFTGCVLLAVIGMATSS